MGPLAAPTAHTLRLWQGRQGVSWRSRSLEPPSLGPLRRVLANAAQQSPQGTLEYRRLPWGGPEGSWPQPRTLRPKPWSPGPVDMLRATHCQHQKPR